MRLILALLILCAGVSAKAQVSPYTNVTPTIKALNAVALTAAPASRTITKNLYRNGVQQPAFSKARLVINYTFSAASAVTVAFSCAVDGATFGQLTSRSISGATATVSSLTDSIPVAASTVLFVDYDVRGCLVAKWLFAGTGAGAGDIVSVDLVTLTGI